MGHMFIEKSPNFTFGAQSFMLSQSGIKAQTLKYIVDFFFTKINKIFTIKIDVTVKINYKCIISL